MKTFGFGGHTVMWYLFSDGIVAFKAVTQQLGVTSGSVGVAQVAACTLLFLALIYLLLQ